ncbi:MAG: HD domain-containing protein [Deltaproteobacteria bacterium]|nr:HD domain-containing protein [Deltaproteobacteria bacterium]
MPNPDFRLKPQIPKFVTFILNRLKRAGHHAYIVGGAVRDYCLKRATTDWDVATSATPGEIKTVFHGIRLFALKHDTVTLVDSGHHFEVTTFRGKKNNIEVDLGHRDFTINAMAFDLENEEILDPHGGKSDIKRKLVRAVGDPDARFREDPLRLLRAVRLATELKLRIETETLNTLTRMAPLLRLVAAERIREELMKILISPKPSTGFNLMVKTGLLTHFLPELLEGYKMRQNSYHRYTVFRHIMETLDRVEPDPVLRLTALLHDVAKPRVREKTNGEWRFLGHEKASAGLSEQIMDRFKFSKHMIRKVTNIITHHMIGYNTGWTNGAIRRLIRRVGLEDIMDLIAFRRADIFAHGLNDHKSDILDELEKRIIIQLNGPMAGTTQDLAIDGYKVMERLGISPGPKVGEILKQLMEKVTDCPEMNNKETLLGLLDTLTLSP